MTDDKDTYYRVTNTYEDDKGNSVEVNQVVYDRGDGSIDYVEQTKVNGVEVGHHTEHPDGTIHDFGIYADNNEEDDDDDDDYEEDVDNYNNDDNDDDDDDDED